MKIEIKYFLLVEQRCWSMHKKYIFFDNTPFHSMSRLISMSQAVACDSQAVAEASKLLKIGRRRVLVEKLLYLTVGPDILWNIFMIWLITFTRNAFNASEMSVDLLVYICDVTFEICARAEHQVIRAWGNSCLNKGQTFIKYAIPLKNILTCWSMDIP